MVELLLPKQAARVRFPSSAPHHPPGQQLVTPGGSVNSARYSVDPTPALTCRAARLAMTAAHIEPAITTANASIALTTVRTEQASSP